MLFLTVSSLITGWLSISATKKIMDSSLNERFESTMSGLNSVLGIMGESASDLAKLLSTQEQLRQAIKHNDADNINELLEQYTVSANTKLIIILDTSGTVVSDTNNGMYTGRSFKDLSVYKDTINTVARRVFITEFDGELISLSPALITGQNIQDGPIGVILVGFPVDAARLKQMKLSADIDISIISKQHILATTITLSDTKSADILVNTDESHRSTQQQDDNLVKSRFYSSYIHAPKQLTSLDPEASASILLSYPKERNQSALDIIQQQIWIFF